VDSLLFNEQSTVRKSYCFVLIRLVWQEEREERGGERDVYDEIHTKALMRTINNRAYVFG